MRKTVLAALAAMGLVGTAYAQPPQSWVYAGMRGGAMGWETTTASRDAEAGTASTLRFLYFAKPQQREESDFNWVVQNIEFDCAANTFRLMEGAFFNKARHGRSDQPALDEDLPVQSGTPEYVLKMVLCDRATVTNAREATNMADAMDGAMKVALP